MHNFRFRPLRTPDRRTLLPVRLELHGRQKLLLRFFGFLLTQKRLPQPPMQLASFGCAATKAPYADSARSFFPAVVYTSARSRCADSSRGASLIPVRNAAIASSVLPSAASTRPNCIPPERNSDLSPAASVNNLPPPESAARAYKHSPAHDCVLRSWVERQRQFVFLLSLAKVISCSSSVPAAKCGSVSFGWSAAARR